MKKFFAVVACILAMTGYAFGDYRDEGYSGDSWEDAYIIDSAEDFELMFDNDTSGKYFKIGADFDITRSGTSSAEYDYFEGHLDGQNHTITVNITNTSSNHPSSLFGSINSDGTAIKDLNVTGSISATSSASAFAFRLIKGTIENCAFSGNISVLSVSGNQDTVTGSIVQQGVIAGGIAGLNKEDVVLSGNTWPEEYPEYGASSSSMSLFTIHSLDTIQPADLTADSLDQIAQILSLDGELHTIDTANVSSPEEPTQAMRDYAANDNTNLIGKLGVLTVPSEGWYIFKVTLGDELWELVQSQDVSGYKFYGLNDSEASDAQVQSAFILNGLLNTWELLTMSGRKMDKFGVREFFMVGFFNSSQPLSLFIAKTVLALLTGGLSGCNAGIAGALGAVVLVWFIRKRRR